MINGSVLKDKAFRINTKSIIDKAKENVFRPLFMKIKNQ